MITATKNKIDLTRIVELKANLKKNNIHTVCESARCPNKSECFGKKTATFLILGNVCTRHCLFCSVKKDKELRFDENEPERIANFVRQFHLRHAVITSVTRDDLADGGASQFARTILAIRKVAPEVIIEVLTPDFKLNFSALDCVLAAGLEVFNHNMETVSRLYPLVRPEADYKRSLRVLEYVKKKNKNIFTKSGLMLGLGETKTEVEKALRDLKKVGCDIVVLGQYFQPTKDNIPVTRYLNQEEFAEYEDIAEGMDFVSVVAGTYMRSSYLAKEMYEKIKTRYQTL